MRISSFTPIFSFAAVAAAAVFLVLGCGSRTQKKPYGAPTDMTIDSTTTIDFLNVYYYSLRTCVRCHRDRINPDLSTYDAIKSNIVEIQEQISGNQMPPEDDGYDHLTACQKLVLNSWINAGLPKKNGSTLGAPGNACY